MGKEQKDLLIIVPAYNEEKTINKLLDSLLAPDIASVADVLIMNDGSKDRTGEICRERGVNVVDHIYNLGYGSGLQIGYKFATKSGYKYLIQMDADGQHDISNIPVILKELTTADENGKKPDIILGSRFVKGAPKYPSSFLKNVAYVLFRTLIFIGTGQKIKDPTTGLQGLSRRAFEYYSHYSNFDDRYPDANMIMQMILLGYRVKEIPALMHTRKEGVSMHSGLKPVIYMMRMTLSICAVWLRIKLVKKETGVE